MRDHDEKLIHLIKVQRELKKMGVKERDQEYKKVQKKIDALERLELERIGRVKRFKL